MEGLRPGDPEQVGRYRLLNRLGAGGMGQVYLGQSPSGRLVAVKIIRADLADDPAFRQRFAQEVTAARRVGGMFTAPVVDADPEASQPWMVTAFVSGPNLAEAVTTRGSLPARSVFMLAAGLAEGLGAIHAVGLVHRDLKPSNVLLASDGPRIIDFGISRAADAATITRAGGVIGSPGFMSPEQAEGRQVGPASDIFSLGSVLAFAAAGEPPFGEGSPSVMLYRVIHEPPSIDNVPAELRPLIARCLAKDPADRPTTDELLTELGYPEPTEDWLGWQDSADRVGDTDTTEPGVSGKSGLPVLGAAAVAAGAAGLAGEALAPASAAAASGWPAAQGGALTPTSGSLAALAYYERPTPPPAPQAGYEHSAPPLASPPGYEHSAANGAAPVGYEHSSPNGSSGSNGHASPNGSSAGHEQPSELGALLASGQYDQGSGFLPPNDLGPDYRRRRRLLLGAAVIMLAAVAAAVVVFGLVSHQSPSKPLAGHGTKPPASALGQKPPASAPSQNPSASAAPSQPPVGGGGPPSGGPTTPAPSQSTTPIAPQQVVLDYLSAINNGDWNTAWTLGGDNLYPTVTALQAAYSSVKSLTVTITSVTGNNVLAHVTEVMLTGPTAVRVQNIVFTVVNGVITRQVMPSAAAAALPGPTTSA